MDHGPRAISGLGGIGKTQTAIEYCYRNRDDYHAVLWVLADTETALDSAFAEIARLLDLAGGTPEEIREAVKRWLAGTEGYLLVLDNADDPPLLSRYLPPAPRGHVLITSRASDFAGLNLEHPEEVPVLPANEALTFLLHRAGRPSPDAAERDAAESLAGELGYLPLALEQAAAFIDTRKCSFGDYLASYRRRRLAILEKQPPEAGGPHAGVAKTWAINFEQVRQESKAAADLLRLSAFLAPEAIPHRILLAGAAHLGPALSAALAGATEDPLILDEVLAIPARYSLIRRDPDAGTYEMHRMVQEVLQAGMSGNEQRRWAERAVNAVNAAFTDVEFANWGICEVLLPHAFACFEHIERWGVVSGQAGRLLAQVGLYLSELARYLASEALCRRALEIYGKALGPEHPAVLPALNNLAALLYRQGRYREALPLFLRVLSLSEQMWGPEHHLTTVCINNLAGLYDSLGQYADGEPLYLRALAIRERTLGPDKVGTAQILHNLALNYTRQARHTEAESLLRRALAIRERSLAADHPLTASTRNNLARVLEGQGRYAEAEPLYRSALATYEKALGPEHPDTALVCQNLAGLLRATGRPDEAEKMEARAREIREAHARRNAAGAETGGPAATDAPG